MKPAIKFLFHGCVFGILTLLTQIGGIAYLAALGLGALLRGRIPRHRAAATTGLAMALYGALTYAVVPALAPHVGRVRLPCTLSPLLACLLNRTYVRPGLAALIQQLDTDLARGHPDSHVTVLDSGFPFFDGFPLLPHLSHDDGRKVDLAFFYRDAASGAPIPAGAASPIGYFHFERPGDSDAQPCAGRFTPLRWDFAWAQPQRPAWILDEERTRAMILWWKAQAATERMFIEPYLAERLEVAGGPVGFQGCQAARHDDHLHVQVR